MLQVAVGHPALFQILLVVFLCPVEGACGDDLRYNRTGEPRLLLPQGSFRFGFLHIRVIKDRGTVLGSDIGALLIQRGGVVVAPENFQELCVGDQGRVKGEVYHLRVSRTL